jgi:hypothetical protein
MAWPPISPSLAHVAAWFNFNDDHSKRLENLSYIATMIGVPIALASYIRSLVVESHRREVGTYDTLETQYVEFQKTALEHPKLDVADKALSSPPILDELGLVQQRALYMVLFSLFERAFLMYRSGLAGDLLMSRMRRQQWISWIDYIDRYLKRQSCRDAWFNDGEPREDVGQDFDPRFERFIWSRYQHWKASAQTAPKPLRQLSEAESA